MGFFKVMKNFPSIFVDHVTMLTAGYGIAFPKSADYLP